MHFSIPAWKHSPFCRIIVPVIAGIIFSFYLNPPFQILQWGFILSILLFFILSKTKFSTKYKLRKVSGALILFILFLVAAIITNKKANKNQPDWYGNQPFENKKILVKLNEPLLKRNKTSKAEAKVLALIDGENKIPASGKIIIYFKGEINDSLKYGSEILFLSGLTKIKNSGNPGSFDYKKYCELNGIYHLAFAGQKNYKVVGNSPDYFKNILIKSRERIVEILANHFTDQKVRGIAEALLIGYKENLDKDLLQSYSNTGVVHVIAISGLHLGLIYVILVWIFSRIPVVKNKKLIYVFGIILLLWAFAFLTGGSASVLRSALMFSCFLIGKNFFRKSSTYNTIAASAFLLLCYNPFYLWDVGFMLSYLAVIGIIWLQQPIYKLLFIKFKLLNEIWKMVSVTIAAQLLTFPLCIYYFHQFPNMFILTNLIAVPLSSLILFLEIILVSFSFLPFINYLGLAISGLLKFMNNYIEWMDSFKFSVSDGLFGNVLSTILLYSIVICFFIKKRISFNIFSYSALLYISVYSIENLKALTSKKIIFYNVPHNTAIDFVSGRTFSFIGSMALNQEGILKNFHLKPTRVNMMLKQENNSNIKITGSVIQFYSKTIIHIDTLKNLSSNQPQLKVDVLLMSNNNLSEIKNLCKKIKPGIVVFDGSNSMWKIEKWKKECEELNLPYHSVADKGALILPV